MLPLCSDKTGTLTENVMVFKEVVVICFNQDQNLGNSVHLVCLIMRTLTRLAWEGASTAKRSCSIRGLYPCAPSLTWRAGTRHTSSSLNILVGKVLVFLTPCHNLTIFRGNEGEARREVSEERRIAEFLTALALCHTVQVAIQPTDSMLVTCLVIFHCFFFSGS